MSIADWLNSANCF